MTWAEDLKWRQISFYQGWLKESSHQEVLTVQEWETLCWQHWPLEFSQGRYWDETHYSCRCQSSRFIILSSTAAKLAPRVSKWVGSSEGDDRKEPEGLSWHPSKCSIKGKQREHCNFCFKFKEHKESHNNVNFVYHWDGQKGCELDLYTPLTLFDFYRNYSFR